MRVSIIMAIEVPTAIATDHQVAPKSVRQTNPIKELKKCPPTTFRGCENGTSGNPKIKTQDAPKDPNTSAVENVFESNVTALIAKKPPSQAIKIDLIECFGGNFALSPFNFSNKFIVNLTFLCLITYLFDSIKTIVTAN